MSPGPKEFQHYITEPTAAHVGHEDYLKSPACAFLKYTVEAKSAISLCERKFPTKGNGGYTKDSLDSLQHLVAAMVPAIMGHFETFERYLFAGLFDLSVHLEKFDVEGLFKRLANQTDFSVDPVRLSAHRGLGTESIGLLMADSLPGWHDPGRVNAYFGSFGLQRQLFSGDSCERLSVLWQMRHSIVHTGGTLTLADAQKVPRLAEHGNKKLVFENQLISEISRKLHPIIKQSTEGVGAAFSDRLKASTPPDVRQRIKELFLVKSSVDVWLR